MRSLAVVPPLMLEGHQRRIYYDNTNGIVEDPMEGHRERQLLNVWTEQVSSLFLLFLPLSLSLFLSLSFTVTLCIVVLESFYILFKLRMFTVLYIISDLDL